MITNLVPLLGVIFVLLIAGSIQSISADHLESSKGIFKDENTVNLAQASTDSKYQIYLHVVIRNAQDQLVSVSEATHGYYLPHQFTDQMIDKMQPGDNLSKEIVIIDKMKYEKIHLIDTYDEQTVDTEIGVDIRTKWTFTVDEYIDGHGLMRLPIFKVSVPVHPIAVDDVLTLHWTILRIIN